MFDSLAKAGKYLGQAAKLMIGMPDYDNYVEHMRVNHLLYGGRGGSGTVLD